MNTLERITQFNASLPQRIPTRAEVVEWLHNDDLEVLGVMFYMLNDERCRDVLAAVIDDTEATEFFLNFLKRCILENPTSYWALEAYPAAWWCATWLKTIWNQQGHRPKALRVKKWLEELLLSGDIQVRNCIVTGTLEHVFEDDTICEFFSDWKGNNVLEESYHLAALWRAHGGSSEV